MTPAELAAWEIVHQRYTVEHESGHAAAALILGLEMSAIRVDHPSETSRGSVKVHGYKAFPREAALVILAGPLCDDTTDDPRWPLPCDEDASSDERRLKELTADLGYGEDEWNELVLGAHELIARPEFDRAHRAFQIALDLDPLIEGEHLCRLTEYIHDLGDPR